ncbi:MAG TPA: LacI family DNA-binding transcriptional regulator [Acidobacteriaceae bacterium]|jgi:LacI family transcriptional regulator
MANMKQIAQLAGVSLGTVSHVLNGTVRVREPLRKRVMDAVNVTGYQPNQLARGLRREKTNIMAMIIPDILNPFFPGVVRGAEDVAFANGFRLVLCNTDNDHEKEVAHLSALQTYLPSGLIVIPSDSSDLTVQAEPYRKAGSAVVCLDRLPRNWGGDSVTVNSVAGAANAVTHLIGLGHRNIAAITGPLHLTNSQDRLKGFKRALKTANIQLPAGYIQETSFDRAGGYSKAKILFRMVPRPTAIMAFNDLIALGALMAIHEANLHCPRDISLVGFDGLDLTEITTPQITSVYQSPYQLGAEAANLVLERLENRSGAPRKIVLKTELRIRDSMGPAPRKPTGRSQS